MTLFETLSAIYARDLAIGAPAFGFTRSFDAHGDRETAGALRAETFAHAVGTVKSWIAKVRDQARNRSAARELARLDDRLLADIGVPRSAIAYMVVHGLETRPVNDDERPAYAGCA